ncbi:MAG TPA: NADH-quinone oxidoreductase subunit E [Kosmotogaceae bacterium]|nr:MAG: NADH dehydrogenase (Ubiquinone) 24 kDa subunit [Thermotogales bacterium 46_20]HAA86076.1 NADH-quinone oxidoreductase subunit E [Kosmotogaceae bacterium]
MITRDDVSKTVHDIYEKITQESFEEGDMLINALHAIQDHYGNYIPLEAAEALKELTGLPLAKIYEVMTFYTMFSNRPRGKYVIRVCKSLPCHVSRGGEVLDALKNKLGVDFSETTEDGLFTLEESSCLGLCGVSPVLMVNDEAYGNLTPERVEEIIDTLVTRERSDEE